AGVEPDITRSLQMKYAAQVFDVQVPLAPGRLDDARARAIGEEFAAIYDELFGEGSGYAEAGVIITNVTLQATVPTHKPQLPRIDEKSSGAVVSRSRRSVYWAEEGTEL